MMRNAIVKKMKEAHDLEFARWRLCGTGRGWHASRDEDFSVELPSDDPHTAFAVIRDEAAWRMAIKAYETRVELVLACLLDVCLGGYEATEAVMCEAKALVPDWETLAREWRPLE
jgi:hypothetical protein